MTVIKQRENNSKHQHLLPTRPSHTSPHQRLREEGKPRPQSRELQSRRGWGTNEVAGGGRVPRIVEFHPRVENAKIYI